jgi:hypothetical protein
VFVKLEEKWLVWTDTRLDDLLIGKGGMGGNTLDEAPSTAAMGDVGLAVWVSELGEGGTRDEERQRRRLPMMVVDGSQVETGRRVLRWKTTRENARAFSANAI